MYIINANVFNLKLVNAKCIKNTAKITFLYTANEKNKLSLINHL